MTSNKLTVCCNMPLSAGYICVKAFSIHNYKRISFSYAMKIGLLKVSLPNHKQNHRNFRPHPERKLNELFLYLYQNPTLIVTIFEAVLVRSVNFLFDTLVISFTWWQNVLGMCFPYAITCNFYSCSSKHETCFG